MRRQICIALTLQAGLAALLHAASVCAQERAPRSGDADGSDLRDYRLRDSGKAARSAHEQSLSWGTGSLVLLGERTKMGTKVSRQLGDAHEWHRTYSAGVTGRQELVPGLALAAGAQIARTKSGFVGGPLLTRQTQAVSQKAWLRLDTTDDRTGVELSVFDNRGWSTRDLADSANRMMNGETRARKGAAAELGLLGSGSGARPDGKPQLSLRLEHAASPGLASESSAALRMKVAF